MIYCLSALTRLVSRNVQTIHKERGRLVAPFIDRGKSPSPTYVNTTAIVEACDIPILSSTDRLQRTLLRWIDVCGMSGQLFLDMDVVDALTGHQFLDEQTYLVEIEGTDPSRWEVIWAGADTAFDSQVDFREAFISTIPEERYVDLVAQEYADAIRYRRASARRFTHRDKVSVDTMDQLIFPIRDAGRTEFVLVVGEAVTGRSLYWSGNSAADLSGETQ